MGKRPLAIRDVRDPAYEAAPELQMPFPHDQIFFERKMRMNAYIKDADWDSVNAYVRILKDDGLSEKEINNIITVATAHAVKKEKKPWD